MRASDSAPLSLDVFRFLAQFATYTSEIGRYDKYQVDEVGRARTQRRSGS